MVERYHNVTCMRTEVPTQRKLLDVLLVPYVGMMCTCLLISATCLLCLWRVRFYRYSYQILYCNISLVDCTSSILGLLLFAYYKMQKKLPSICLVVMMRLPKKVWSLLILLLMVNRVMLLRNVSILSLRVNQVLALAIWVLALGSTLVSFEISDAGYWNYITNHWYGAVLCNAEPILLFGINTTNIALLLYIFYQTREIRKRQDLSEEAKDALRKGKKFLLGLGLTYSFYTLGDIVNEILEMATLSGYHSVPWVFTIYNSSWYCDSFIVYNSFACATRNLVSSLLLLSTSFIQKELSKVQSALLRGYRIISQPSETNLLTAHTTNRISFTNSTVTIRPEVSADTGPETSAGYDTFLPRPNTQES